MGQNIEFYEAQIRECLGEKVNHIELVSSTNNIVFRVDTAKYGTAYAKFYLENSSHIDHEMELYGLIDSKFLKEVIITSTDPKMAVFDELKGKTIDELSQEEIEKNKEKIIDSLIYFYETLGKNKIKGYGLLDKDMKGKSSSFQDFIIERQTKTQETLKDYPVLNNTFSKIFEKYKDLLIGDNSLVPIDTNAKNVMLTQKRRN